MGLSLFQLDGKVAAVTGSTRGIGRSIAIGLAEAGADVALLQRSAENTATRDEIRHMGRRCEIVLCELADAEQVKQAIPAVVKQFERIDILVNNAGIQRRSPATEFSEVDWDDVLQVNLKAIWLLCQAAGREMLAQGGGKIINIASLMSFQGGMFIPAYAAAKGGVSQLTKALSNEWAKHNVNVNAIAPGYIATEINTSLWEDETRNREILARIPAGRWGSADDLKGAAIYLASSASNYVSGTVLTVDGGWMGR